MPLFKQFPQTPLTTVAFPPETPDDSQQGLGVPWHLLWETLLRETAALNMDEALKDAR